MSYEVNTRSSATAMTTTPTIELIQISAFLFTSSFGLAFIVAGFLFGELIDNQPLYYIVKKNINLL
jgi:hypothetical protein